MSGTPPTSPGVLQALGIGLRAMRRRPLLAAGFLIATLIQGTLQGLLIWTLRHVLESFGTPRDVALGSLLGGALLILGVWVLRSFSSFAAETLSVHLAYRVETESMLEVLTRLLKLSIRFFDRTSQADVVMASYYDLKGIRAVTLEVGKAVLYLSQLAGLAAAAWMMSPSLAIIGLVSVPLGVLPAYRFGLSITEAARGEREAVTTLHQSFHQVATAIRVIKVNRGQAQVVARAQELARELHHHLIRQAVQKGMARLLLEAVSGLGLALMLVMGGRDVASGALSWQALLGLMIAMMAVYSPIVGLVQLYGTIRSVIPSLDRIQTIMREPAEIEDQPDARPLPTAPAVIELRDVGFAYRDRPVLEGVSATFHRGETVGIVGPSGAGKSTLISLLLRFYDPSRGGIYLDGVDLRAIRHADLMDRSSIVLQEPLLFMDTVANNIRFGRPAASIEQVIAAAKAANIHDEVLAMEQGYDTLLGVGRGARGISAGQKQRLAIAAALLKNAPILFLDEATSSLDAVSEQRVQVAIEHLMAGRTTFVIAHRFSTLRKAERILVLDAGRMVGFGTHEQLLTICPTYRMLWETQGAPPVFVSPPAGALMEAADG